MTPTARALAFCLGACLSLASAAPAGVEQRLQAALVYKLPRFVEWPARRLPPGRGPFRICLLGQSGTLAEALKKLRGRRAKGHPIEVLVGPALDEMAGACHLVFVAHSQRARLPLILARLDGAPVLTVSALKGFAGRGGMVGIVRQGKRLGFEIDLGRARAAGLTLAAPLLQISKVIDP